MKIHVPKDLHKNVDRSFSHTGLHHWGNGHTTDSPLTTGRIHQAEEWPSITLWWVKEASYRSINMELSHFDAVLELHGKHNLHGKTWDYHDSGRLWGCGWGLPGNRHEGTSWSDGKSLYLDKGLGYTGVCTGQKSANIHVKFRISLCINFTSKEKNIVNKYWTLINKIHDTDFSGKEFISKCIKNKRKD